MGKAELTRRAVLKAGVGGAVGWAAANMLGGLKELLAQQPTSAGGGGRKLNVLFILMDDMGWMDLAFQGSKVYRTPCADKLASQSMRFTNAYAACPVCSPTRASILTGRYPATVGLTDYIPGHARPWAKLKVPPFHQQLPAGEQTIAQFLKADGYATACIGKWHLGAAPATPESFGFDFAIDKVPNDQDKMASGLTVEACKFMEANRDKPFFLYLAHHAVHLPIQAKPELVEKYKPLVEGQTEQSNPAYAAMVEATDRTIGTLLGKLDELRLSDNTVVIFFSDNGGLKDKSGKRITSNAPLRGGKGMLYEGGIREPLLVRWPGVVAAGGTCDHVVASIDFLPTILEIAGVQAKPANPIDGVSLLPLLKHTGLLADRPVYWHYPHYHMEKPSGAIRKGNYKLIEFFEDGRLELYDLAATTPGKAAELQADLAAWRKKVHAQMPTPNPDYDPDRADQSPPPARGKAKPAEE